MMPSDPLRDAIRALRAADDWHEYTPVVNVHVQAPRAELPTVPDSSPPGAAMSVHGPGGLRVRQAPAWLVLALGIVAIVGACWAYVATH